MAYRKITLRRLPESTRDLARLINELESVTRRLKNFLSTVETLELNSRALDNVLDILERISKEDEEIKKDKAELFEEDEE